jgi:23S rRNA pseudouridine2457 synthase
MAKYFVLHKPYGYMCQFSPVENKKVLADLNLPLPKNVYPVGRLDENSEGLLLLSSDKAVTDKLLNPINEHSRTYLVQVEGQITKKAIKQLKEGVDIKLTDKIYKTKPAEVKKVGKVNIADREPPVRENIQTSWVKITLTEGKNRQVRKMTAAVGFPTLRLIRTHIEDLELGNLAPGSYLKLDKPMFYNKLKLSF